MANERYRGFLPSIKTLAAGPVNVPPELISPPESPSRSAARKRLNYPEPASATTIGSSCSSSSSSSSSSERCRPSELHKTLPTRIHEPWARPLSASNPPPIVHRDILTGRSYSTDLIEPPSQPITPVGSRSTSPRSSYFPPSDMRRVSTSSISSAPALGRPDHRFVPYGRVSMKDTKSSKKVTSEQRRRRSQAEYLKALEELLCKNGWRGGTTLSVHNANNSKLTYSKLDILAESVIVVGEYIEGAETRRAQEDRYRAHEDALRAREDALHSTEEELRAMQQKQKEVISVLRQYRTNLPSHVQCMLDQLSGEAAASQTMPSSS
jgi:hypothetical protein